MRELPQSAIALDITVPKGVANEIHLKTLAKLAKSSNMDGFRAGKVPPQAVIAKLGMQKVKEATVEQIIEVGMSQSGVGQRARLPSASCPLKMSPEWTVDADEPPSDSRLNETMPAILPPLNAIADASMSSAWPSDFLARAVLLIV